MDLKSLGINELNNGACIGGRDWIDCSNNDSLISYNPTNGDKISEINLCNELMYNDVMNSSRESFEKWRMLPAPKRGELIYQIALKLNEKIIDFFK